MPLQRTAPEDWRVLRLLSFYRLALIALLLALMGSGYTPQILLSIKPDWYRWTVLAYTGFAMLLTWQVMSGDGAVDLVVR